MVCVPCFIIPVLLYVWHRFLQPILLRYWNPWAVRDATGQITENRVPEFPFQCAGGQCPFPVGGRKAEAAAEQSSGAAAGSERDGDAAVSVGKDDAEKKID